MQRHIGAQCKGPATIHIKNLDQTSFPYRAVKTFSVATHLLRGIILNIRECFRWGTSDSRKLSTWDYVDSLYVEPPPTVYHPNWGVGTYHSTDIYTKAYCYKFKNGELINV